jgi:hypothetical protein
MTTFRFNGMRLIQSLISVKSETLTSCFEEFKLEKHYARSRH